jgi:glutaminyl-peptide cyclotransferase
MKTKTCASWVLAFLGALSVSLTGCGRERTRSPSIPPVASNAVATYHLEVVHAWPHDRGAFTQGLLFRDGRLVESTGLYGRSSLREVDLESGRIFKQITVPPEYFAEGLTALGSKLYQLTWREHTAFVYDADTFQRLGEFTYEGEGWGLTTDGVHLILSDGTAQIRFLDATTFKVIRTIEVRDAGKPVDQLNELEYVRGEILANVWQTNRILRIEAASGRVVGVVDCTGLLPAADRAPNTDVLNGIAYDAVTDRLVLTGKLWPSIFEVRLRALPEDRTGK